MFLGTFLVFCTIASSLASSGLAISQAINRTLQANDVSVQHV